jgi:predicted  nucleic acid-binding Zn-ribbon protein
MKTFLKYEPEVSAADPLMRCDDCKKVVAKEYIAMKGNCNHCGNRRFKTISKMEEADLLGLRSGEYPLGIAQYEVDPAFLNLFTPEVAE